MKRIKIWVLSACVFITINHYGQESERLNYTDSLGRKQGHWIVKTDKGLLKYDGFFKDGKPVGIMKRYDEYGLLKAELRYVGNTGTVAYAKLFYEGGLLAAEGKYVNQKRDSLWKFYSYYTKKLVAEENYVNGIKHGPSKVYYENGHVAEYLEYKDGKKEGPWKQYFDDGTLKLDAAYSNDKKNGPYKYYFPDGKLESEGAFRDDKMDGWWVYYNEDGTVRLKVEYAGGKPVDPKVIEEYEQEFFRKVEEMKGKIPEIDENEFFKENMKLSPPPGKTGGKDKNKK